MKIYGINNLTLLDYPGHVACTLFAGHCNLRCPYCHNASLVLNPRDQPTVPEDDIFNMLAKRQKVLDGVCISGGEPAMHDDLPVFIGKVKELGFNVKLDTNGFFPDMMAFLLKDKLIDYVAMDIKNTLDKYPLTTGMDFLDVELVKKSVEYVMNADIPYEFRTTVVSEFHSREDFVSIGYWLRGAKSYYLQSFKDSGDLIGRDARLTPYPKDEMEYMRELLLQYIEKVEIR